MMVHSVFICFRSLNLYWADAGPGMGRVEVVRLDGSSRRVLVWRHGQTQVHRLAIHPTRQILYVSIAGDFSFEEGGARLKMIKLKCFSEAFLFIILEKLR
jgi:hypothetical protein